MVAFDLLYLNGYDLRTLPLCEKALLKKIIGETDVQIKRELRGRWPRDVQAGLQDRS
jgi:ATP-dependent DNA ligase